MPDTTTTDSPSVRDVVTETPPAPTNKVKGKGTRSVPASDKLCDLHKLLDLESDVHKGTGTFQLMYQTPDFRLLNMSFLTYIGRVFHNANFEPSELVTPPAVIAYFNLCAIFVLFMNDLKSTTPSVYAQEFSSFVNFNRLFNVLSEAVVPPQIAELFCELLPWSPDLMQRLEFLPSLAATMPLYDIPYLLHPLMFLHGHNHLFQRATLVNEFGPFLMQELFTLTSHNVNAAHTLTVRIGNLLGCVYNTDNSAGGNPATNVNLRYVPNWLSELVLPFVNPATHRQHLRRTGLMAYTLESPTHTSATWNPYSYLFQTESATNFTSIVNCIRACSSFTKTELNGTSTLESIRTKVPHLPGSYMISSYTQPTWHTTPLAAGLGTGTDTSRVPIPGTFTGLCDVMKFGQMLASPAAGNRQAFNWPEATAINPAAPGLRIRNFQEQLYMVENPAGASITLPSGIAISAHNEHIHKTPDVLVFAPGDVPPSACGWPLLTGMVVYNGNLDSTTLRTPNPDTSLSVTRSRYVDGFISARLVRPKFTQRPTYIILRQAMKKISFGGFNFFGQSDVLVSPQYHQTETLTTASRLNLFWPITWVLNMVLPQYAFNAIPNTSTVNMNEADQDPRLYQIFEVWSSFRAMSSNERPNVNNVYFGVNHGEAIFGRNSTINKFSHPATLLFRP